MTAPETSTMDRIVALCKRRGFIFQSSEIYGGINGFWDYGPLGCELKRNIKDAWWNDCVLHPPIGPDGREVSMVGVDCSIIMNPKVWEASGHATGFADLMVECSKCKRRFREDKIWSVVSIDEEDVIENQRRIVDAYRKSEESPDLFYLLKDEGFLQAMRSIVNPKLATTVEADSAEEAKSLVGLSKREQALFRELPPIQIAVPLREVAPKDRLCPICNVQLSEPRQFNLMLDTYPGAVRDESSRAYLRPETAQGIFANFRNVCDSTRVRIPFGIAQIGKAFRNEINPRNYTFRSREFEQMEIEFFCHDRDAMKWWEFWRDQRIKWYQTLGLSADKLRPRNQTDKELAHYSKACTDIEYLFPFSDEPQELEGVAHRGCFDLTQHQTHSGRDMTYFDDETKERFIPTVIEPSAGADRATLAFLCDAYTVDESRPSPEFLKLHPRLAPIKAAVFPLVNKDGLPEIAEPIFCAIRQRWPAQYDAKQSIGKRYARMDEAGTPFCFTIDGQTKTDGTVTVRDRDTGAQERIDQEGCVAYLSERLGRLA